MDISAQLPDAIQWSEGMLLSPQHLQQSDIYWSQQLRHLAAALQPYYWGVLDLALDESKLAEGLVCVKQLHAVMPDGLVVQTPEINFALSKVEDKDWPPGRPLRVYLVVPVRTEGAASATSRIQRFESVVGALEIDENSSDSRVEVNRLRPKCELYAGPPVPAKYCAMPLLEIERDAGGHFRRGAYHPPMLRSNAGSFLEEHCLQQQLGKLTETIRAKIRDLVGGRQIDDNIERLDPDARRQLFVARHLAAMLLPLELRLRAIVSHPADLYITLAALAGQLAALGSNPTPPVLDAYNHDDSRPGFQILLRYIETRLALITPPYEAMAFERISDTTFRRKLPTDMRPDTLIIELKLYPGRSEADLRRWLSHARIANEDLMQLLQQRRLPGATVAPIDVRRVHGLNVADGALLFEITNKALEVDGRLSPVIKAERALMIQGAADGHGPREIVLHRAVLHAKPQPELETDG